MSLKVIYYILLMLYTNFNQNKFVENIVSISLLLNRKKIYESMLEVF